jgi:hypothetical protein
MREKLGLGFWILTIILMTASVTDEFVRQQPLSVVSLVFVLTLALSALGLSVVDWAGAYPAFRRLQHSRAFGFASLVLTLVVILAIGLLR